MNGTSEYGEHELIAELTRDLEAAQQQLRETLDLACEEHAFDRRTIKDLEGQVAEMRGQLKTPKKTSCENCEKERRDSAYIGGLWFVMASMLALQGHKWPYELMGTGSLIAGFLLWTVNFRWRWNQFKHRFDWRSPTDNTLYRRFRSGWNGLLAMLMMT